MFDSSDFDRVFARTRVLAIIRRRDGQDVPAILSALKNAGIECAEITTGTPGWEWHIERARAIGLYAGAGTVLTPDHVRRARAAGALFTVSPGLDPRIVDLAMSQGMTPIPGVLTPTEIAAARRASLHTLKLFPAEPSGPRYLKAILAPFDDLQLIATGGVSVPSIPQWRRAGAYGVALASELTGAEHPSAADIQARAAAAITGMTY